MKNFLKNGNRRLILILSVTVALIAVAGVVLGWFIYRFVIANTRLTPGTIVAALTLQRYDTAGGEWADLVTNGDGTYSINPDIGTIEDLNVDPELFSSFYRAKVRISKVLDDGITLEEIDGEYHIDVSSFTLSAIKIISSDGVTWVPDTGTDALAENEAIEQMLAESSFNGSSFFDCSWFTLEGDAAPALLDAEKYGYADQTLTGPATVTTAENRLTATYSTGEDGTVTKTDAIVSSDNYFYFTLTPHLDNLRDIINYLTMDKMPFMIDVTLKIVGEGRVGA